MVDHRYSRLLYGERVRRVVVVARVWVPNMNVSSLVKLSEPSKVFY